MDFQQIKLYLGLVNEMSFTNAADEMHISQSSLSKHIKALEEELNVVLFDRTTRKISLTQAGKDFNIYANQLVKIYDKMLICMKMYSSNVKKKITLTSAQVLSYYGLTDLIMTFCKLHPDLDLIVTEIEPDKVIKQLLNNNTDLGITHLEHMRHFEHMHNNDFDYFPLFKGKLILVIGKSHPLSSEEEVSISQLENETFLFIRVNEFDSRDTISLCAKFGYVPKISPSNLRLNSMEKYILSGNYVTIMPEKLSRSFQNPNICRIKLKETLPRTLGIIVRKSKKTLEIEKLINYILENYHVN